MIASLKQQVLQDYEITAQEAMQLSRVSHQEELYVAANEIRAHFCQNDFDLCSISNAKSGRCSEDCKWCSQSAHHQTTIETYEKPNKDQIVRQALEDAAQGVRRHSLVTSGRGVSDKTLDELISIYREISAQSHMHLCASLGLITAKQMRRLKEEAGVEHYHCNIETAPSFFSSLVSTHSLEEKIKTIKLAQEIGLKVCSGGIIGMGESMEQRIEMAFLLRDLNITSIPINILQPIKGTALEGMQALSEQEILTTIAVFRFIHPKAYLRFAGGRVQIKHFQDKALRAGINAAITGNYLTSTGSDISEDISLITQEKFHIYDEQ